MNNNHKKILQKHTKQTDDVIEKALQAIYDSVTPENLDALAEEWGSFSITAQKILSRTMAGTYNVSNFVALMDGLSEQSNKSKEKETQKEEILQIEIHTDAFYKPLETFVTKNQLFLEIDLQNEIMHLGNILIRRDLINAIFIMKHDFHEVEGVNDSTDNQHREQSENAITFNVNVSLDENMTIEQSTKHFYEAFHRELSRRKGV